MIAIYIFFLAISCSVFGAFVRQVLGELGYVLGFDMALALAAGAAFFYGTLQLAYMTLVRVLKPTRSPGPLISESISFLSVFILAPYLLDVSVQWPHEILAKLEPLVYLGVFGAVHLFLKLATFFAAVRGEAGGRLATGGWLLGACVSAIVSWLCIAHWMGLAEAARPQAASEPKYYRAGDAFAMAREVPEGARVGVDVTAPAGASLVLRWAPAALDEPLERIYVTTRLVGDESEDGSWTVSLRQNEWAELRIPSSSVPANLQRCEIMWERSRRSGWQRTLGLQPLVAANGKALLSGPFVHADASVDRPNFLIIAVEGLGSSRISGFGYKRKTTPSLDALIRRSSAFQNAYSPSPEAAAACMTLLTGVTPARHGYLGDKAGPLPEMFDTLAEALAAAMYATAAFTEAGLDETGDLALGTGFERGFEVFDPSCSDAAVESDNHGARYTLDKVSNWIQQHATQQFFVFVRLRELADPVWRPQYAPGFAPKDGTPSDADVYDSALAYIDKRIGTLMSKLRTVEGAKNTCVIVTSPYGIDFTTPGGPVVGLTEESLRVPLIVAAPSDADPVPQPLQVGLEDVVPTVLALARTGLEYKIDGIDLAGVKEDRPPVSAYGSPLMLSTRADRWRFYWQEGGAVEAQEVARATRRTRQADAALKELLAEQCLVRFENYLKK